MGRIWEYLSAYGAAELFGGVVLIVALLCVAVWRLNAAPRASNVQTRCFHRFIRSRPVDGRSVVRIKLGRPIAEIETQAVGQFFNVYGTRLLLLLISGTGFHRNIIDAPLSESLSNNAQTLRVLACSP